MTQSKTLSHRGRKNLLSPRGGDGKLKSPRMKRFLKEERMEEEKESVLLSVREEQIGGA